MCLPRPLQCGRRLLSLFFFNDTAPTKIYTLSLHDALPISARPLPSCPIGWRRRSISACVAASRPVSTLPPAIPLIKRPRTAKIRRAPPIPPLCAGRSEEHTSELQSHSDLVCRLLLEKKK